MTATVISNRGIERKVSYLWFSISAEGGTTKMIFIKIMWIGTTFDLGAEVMAIIAS
jgi:hypothetical protein